MTCSELQKARSELELLKDDAPQESSIYKLLGRVLYLQNELHGALLNMNTALDMRPTTSEANDIKAEIDRMEDAAGYRTQGGGSAAAMQA